MGQFGRITSIDELPSDDELDRLILEAAQLSKNAPAPRKTKSAPKPPPELRPDFAAALARAPQAKAVLDSFPPSAQRVGGCSGATTWRRLPMPSDRG